MEYNCQVTENGFRVKYSLIPFEDDKEAKFYQELSNAYEEIEQLTNHADGIDYALAVTSGILTGIIDIVIVGEWDFARGKALSNIEINNKITSFAKKQPDYSLFCEYALESGGGKRKKKKDPDRLETAVSYLEWKFPLPGDAPWLMAGYDKKGNIVENKKLSPKSHHLDDLSHHPTIVGLIACIISQFTLKGTYVNEDNQIISIPFSVDENGYIEGKTPVAKIGAGIINWCFNVAKHRYGHLMSDMAGSKSNPGSGMGLPGTVMSILKELSCLPCFNDPEFSKKLSMAYKNGIGAGNGQVNLGTLNCLFEGASSKLDYRTEKAIGNELKRQAVPVAINEVVVRSFYFVRHFIIEMREKNSIDKIDFRKIIPFNNRTIVRMMVIASGTFTLIDVADAAIQGAVKSGGSLAEFGRHFLLRVNIVGIGRFTLAVGADVMMEAKKGRLELAIICGEVAATALTEKRAIKETDALNEQLDEKISDMKQLSKEIEALRF